MKSLLHQNPIFTFHVLISSASLFWHLFILNFYQICFAHFTVWLWKQTWRLYELLALGNVKSWVELQSELWCLCIKQNGLRRGVYGKHLINSYWRMLCICFETRVFCEATVTYLIMENFYNWYYFYKRSVSTQFLFTCLCKILSKKLEKTILNLSS
jgi:hypothetical protein